MKWKRKYNIDIAEIHRLNSEGYTLPELAEMYKIPRTTLNRYLAGAGYVVYRNFYGKRLTDWNNRHNILDFKCVNAWKRTLVEINGYRCQVCGYGKIVEAHHMTPQIDGGRSTIANGILLCPNHHAEAHAGLVDLMALLKLGELLGPLEEGNQQPSRVIAYAKDSEGPETRSRAKAVMDPRAPSTNDTLVKI